MPKAAVFLFLDDKGNVVAQIGPLPSDRNLFVGYDLILGDNFLDSDKGGLGVIKHAGSDGSHFSGGHSEQIRRRFLQIEKFAEGLVDKVNLIFIIDQENTGMHI